MDVVCRFFVGVVGVVVVKLCVFSGLFVFCDVGLFGVVVYLCG